VLLTAVVISVFLTITISNRQLIVTSETRGNLLTGWLTGIGGPTRLKYSSRSQEIREELYGTADTALERNLRLLIRGLTLNLGESERLYYYSGGELLGDVKEIVLDSLPRTLLLFGTANFLIFIVSISLALLLVGVFGGWLDKILTSLAPVSAVPSWLYGLILTVIFARVLHIFVGGIWDGWPSEFKWEHIPVVLKALMIPVLAIFISKFFQSMYVWRNFFQINSGEDFVEMAKAKGLPQGSILRNYVLRPSLPGIITSFVLIIILIWQEAIIIELFFGVAGIGHLFYSALAYSDMPLVVGLSVTFAYLLAFSVFFLDILYAFVDPRIKVGNEGRLAKSASHSRRRLRLPSFRRIRSKRQFHRQSLSIDKKQAGFPQFIKGSWNVLVGSARQIKRAFRELFHHPGAVIGLVIVAVLFAVSLFTIFALPYERAISIWRGDDGVNTLNPQKVQPAWTNYFRRDKLPGTIILDSQDESLPIDMESGAEGAVSKAFFDVTEEMREIVITFAFDYPYAGFPQDIVLMMDLEYEEKWPFVTFTLLTPDGREIELGNYSSLFDQDNYSLAKDDKLKRRLDDQPIMEALFADPNSDELTALQGTYALRVNAFVFEEQADVDAQFVLYGQVHGLAGTDHQRRDLMVGLLWGTPIALAFGLLAALGISFSTMLIAAFSTWYGGWVDRIIQWITEVNMVLPMFIILLLVFNYYSMRIWTMLGVTIILSVFGASIKTYRSIFLQVKEAPYIEAARAYGASNFRIIKTYLVPRIISVVIPQLIILVPTFVFLETTLAYLGMSDPLLPTWGKVIREALANGALNGDYYWLIEPFGLLLVTAFAFLILGHSLERIFDPRLRER